MGFNEGHILLSNNATYAPGQMLCGRLEFSVNEQKKMRGIYAEIKGRCRVRWVEQNGRRQVTYEAKEEYLHVVVYMVGNTSGEVTLQPGHHAFPFECQIPPHCPSSFDEKHGKVWYQVKVVVDRAFLLNQTKIAPFWVAAPFDLNCDPSYKEPIDFAIDQVFCSWCVISGGAETIVKLPATGFCPGQIIPIEMSCTNTSSTKIKKIKLSIKKTTTFTVRQDHTRDKKVKIAELQTGAIPGHTTRNWIVEMKIPDMNVCNLNNCGIIDIDYEFKVHIVSSGCNIDEEETRPIYIGSIPLVAPVQHFPNSNVGVQVTQEPHTPHSYPSPSVVNQPLPNYHNGSSPYQSNGSPPPNYPNASSPPYYPNGSPPPNYPNESPPPYYPNA